MSSSYFQDVRTIVQAELKPFLDRSVTLRVRTSFISYSILRGAPKKVNVFDVWLNKINGTVFYWFCMEKIGSSDDMFGPNSPCLINEEKILIDAFNQYCKGKIERNYSLRWTIELVDNKADAILKQMIFQHHFS